MGLPAARRFVELHASRSGQNQPERFGALLGEIDVRSDAGMVKLYQRSYPPSVQRRPARRE
jgi:hypothetical protein